VKILATASLTLIILALTACGGSNPSSSTVAGGALTGNWQFSLSQLYPAPAKSLFVSGFLTQSNDVLAGSVVGPTIVNSSGIVNCGGTAEISGTISSQSVTFIEDLGGTAYNFTGTISSDSHSMSGQFSAPGGACFTTATSGTWSAVLVPPLNGNFTGTISGSNYMALLTGANPVAPIAVSGSITQSTNAGASVATLTGTITAVGYPCLTTGSLTGTISGQNVYLNVYDYSGALVGDLGQPSGSAGTPGSPATVVVDSTSGISLVDSNSTGLFLGVYNGTSVVGPCPPLSTTNGLVTSDGASVVFSFQ